VRLAARPAPRRRSDSSVADPGNVEPIFALQMPVNCDGPLVTVEGVFGFAALLPQPGAYDFTLSIDGEFLSTRRLVLIGLPPQAPEEPPV
jgi:hypothetical protein